jgi:transposase
VGAHFWTRELIKLGHDARLMPARYVRAYVKTNKHDAADPEPRSVAERELRIHIPRSMQI